MVDDDDSCLVLSLDKRVAGLPRDHPDPARVQPFHHHPGLPRAVGSHDLHARPPRRALPGRGLRLSLWPAEMEAQMSMTMEATVGEGGERNMTDVQSRRDVTI